jgi:hypothetical protein
MKRKNKHIKYVRIKFERLRIFEEDYGSSEITIGGEIYVIDNNKINTGSISHDNPKCDGGGSIELRILWVTSKGLYIPELLDEPS